MADKWNVVSVAPETPPEWKVSSVEPVPFNTSKMVGNAGESFYKNTIGGLVQLLSSPVQTAQGLGDIVAGGVYNALPAPVQRGLTAIEQSKYNPLGDPASLERAQKIASAAGQDLATSYTTKEGFKQMMQEDPFRPVADISTLLGGGGALLKAGTTGAKAANVANAMTKAGNVMNPFSQAALVAKGLGKGAEFIGKGYLASKSGVGMEPINQAIKAGSEGNQTFLENMRDKVPSLQVLDDAKAALAQMNADKAKDYRSGMVNIKNDKTVLDFTGIDQALTNAENMVSFKGKIKDQTAFNVLEDMKKKVADWKNSNPADYHTPEGMDALKQTLWSSFGKLGQEEKTAFSAGKQVYDAVKSEIGKQAPTYAEVMKNYSESSDLINEIERTLSLGNKASADTAMRKLQSLMRNNVNTNYGQRLNLAQELSAAGGKDLMPALAGQAMSSELPRGLQGATNVPTSMLAYSTLGPVAAIGDVLSSSPRLVGETAYKYGQLAGALNKGKEAISSRVPMTAQQAKMAALLANQAGNIGLDQLGDWLRLNQDAATQQQQR
tara:strand:- start:10 stop:1662 length:1653 start_codon:yes stop_codon:yes gene_type:complete